MKKLGKFLFGSLAVATIAAGAYYVYKNYIKKDTTDDFEDFEDDFEDLDSEEASEKDSREYVPINLAPEESTEEPGDLSPLEDATADEQ